jgi:hypothetical protein
VEFEVQDLAVALGGQDMGGTAIEPQVLRAWCRFSWRRPPSLALTSGK